MLIEGTMSFMEYGFVSGEGWWEGPNELHKVEHCGNVLLICNIHQVIDLINGVFISF